jgi:hypothetical protein
MVIVPIGTSPWASLSGLADIALTIVFQEGSKLLVVTNTL